MTGNHKNLVAHFVVHKLVELALARDAAAEDTEERGFDEGVDEEAARAWAKAYANANLSGVMERAGNKAAAMATKFYDQLAARASAHVIQGDNLDSLAVDFDARFKAVYGKPHVRATAPAPVVARNKAAAKPKAGLRGNARHRATVSKLCGEPLPCAALPGLVDRLCTDRLRQCLPELPPTAGAPPSAARLAIIAEQGPLTQGHWLLSELRRAARPEYDGPVCEAFAGSLFYCAATSALGDGVPFARRISRSARAPRHACDFHKPSGGLCCLGCVCEPRGGGSSCRRRHLCGRVLGSCRRPRTSSSWSLQR